MSPSGRAKRNITVFEQETGLLNMTRLEAGYVKARLDWCDVSDLVQVTLKEIEKDLTQQQILREVWGPNALDQTHYLRVSIAHLRGKLERDVARPQLITTEPGIGYRLMAAG